MHPRPRGAAVRYFRGLRGLREGQVQEKLRPHQRPAAERKEDIVGNPFMPLFVGDFLASTAHWDGEERSLYLLLLAYQWSAGPLPTEVKRLAKMSQYDLDRFEKLWPVVAGKFEVTDAGLVNPRLEEHRQKALSISQKRADLGKAGAVKRWQTDGNSHSKSNGNSDSTSDSNSHDFANGKTIASIPYQSIPNQSKTDTPLSPPLKGGARARQMPEGFAASESHRELAAELGVDVTSELVAFTDYHRSKGSTFKDWDAALRTWLRNARRFGKPVPVKPKSNWADQLDDDYAQP